MGKKKNIIELTNVSCSRYRELPKMELKVVADNVRSMMNIGSILRTSDAFLVEEVVMCGISGVPPHPEIHKTALGAEQSVAWHYEKDAIECCRLLKESGYTLCVLEQAHDSIPLQDFSPDKNEKYAIVVGNEVEGVNQQIVDMADVVLEIPQYGTKHSLNVSVSAALAIWKFFQSLA